MMSSLDSYPKDGLVYCVERITHTKAFLVCDGQMIYAAEIDSADDKNRIPAKTDYLELCLGVDLELIEGKNPQGSTQKLDFIRLNADTSDRELRCFIEICRSHALSKDQEPLESFFYSLCLLFSSTSKEKRKTAIGLFGELSIIAEYEKCEIDVSKYWQLSGLRTKYDFTFPCINLEVKTTTGKEKLAKLKHDQLFNTDKNYLAFVRIEENPSGSTLNSLSKELLESANAFNGLREMIILNKELLQINANELSIPYKLIDISCYDKGDINPFQEPVPQNVSRLEYLLDLSGLDYLDTSSMARLFDETCSG